MWVCRAAYTILLKYAGIVAVHIFFMIANISVLHAMQLAVTGRVWVDDVKLRTSFLVRTRFYDHNVHRDHHSLCEPSYIYNY